MSEMVLIRDGIKVDYRSLMNDILVEIEQLKAELDKFRTLDNDRIRDALAIEYTYESNRIEGNTLTLRETDLVINKGLTIGGKRLPKKKPTCLNG